MNAGFMTICVGIKQHYQLSVTLEDTTEQLLFFLHEAEVAIKNPTDLPLGRDPFAARDDIEEMAAKVRVELHRRFAAKDEPKTEPVKAPARRKSK
jgi:hypothetical protein